VDAVIEMGDRLSVCDTFVDGVGRDPSAWPSAKGEVSLSALKADESPFPSSLKAGCDGSALRPVRLSSGCGPDIENFNDKPRLKVVQCAQVWRIAGSRIGADEAVYRCSTSSAIRLRLLVIVAEATCFGALPFAIPRSRDAHTTTQSRGGAAAGSGKCSGRAD
jgi:hypothetical protein